MVLTSQARLGSYEVLALIGKGGMGEVFRARDRKLNRDVAIKVLPEAFASDPARLARFKREAQILASLNHPNIAAIYGLEEQDGLHYLVMEFVAGENLRGPLPLDEVLPIAAQIAGGLREAHRKTVVHRDLKPANIRITPEGKVKILDFGLAKALSPVRSPKSDSTVSMVDLKSGPRQIMGTPAYMSPEQARGKPTDQRTDIWAFGCVLFEALTGKRAFRGDSVIDTLTAVTCVEPNWAALPASTPPAVREVVELCLKKEVDHRLQFIADAQVLLERPVLPEESPAAKPQRAFSRLAAVGGLVVVLLAGRAAALLWQKLQTRSEEVWSGVRLSGAIVAMGPRISPDGQLLAFQAMVDGITQVAVMKPESGNWTPLTRVRSRGLVNNICWSPDGTKLYFDRFTDVPRGIFSVPVLGGEERLVLEDAATPQALPDGSLVVERLNSGRRYQLHRFWPQSGRVQPLKALVPGPLNSPPFRVTPNGEKVIFYGKPLDNPNVPDHLYALELSSEKSIRLAPDVSFVPRVQFPLAVTADGQSAMVDLASGDVHHIVSVPIDGSSGRRSVLSLTTPLAYLDAGRDGSIYADQWERPGEVVRLTLSGETVEHMGVTSGSEQPVALALPDGRLLVSSRSAGRERLLLMGLGKEPVAFVETEDETAAPAAVVGDSVAFVIGQGTSRTIALASLADRRVTRRLNGSRGAAITSIASSPDTSTIYYTASGAVWAIPASDGQPQYLRSGDAVTVDPYKGDLIVRMSEKDGVRLVRVPLVGGAEHSIPVEAGMRVASGASTLSPTAVGRDGRILVQVVLKSSWFWPTGLLDPLTGRVQILPIGYDADTWSAGWTPDGKVVLTAAPLRASLWRFRPVRYGR